MKIPAITTALAALVLSTAVAPQAEAASGIRRCVKGSGTGVSANYIVAQNKAKGAAASQIVRYLRNGYQVDPGSIVKSCTRRQQAVFFCTHSVLACKYRHDN